MQRPITTMRKDLPVINRLSVVFLILQLLLCLPMQGQPVVQVSSQAYGSGQTTIVRASDSISTSGGVTVAPGANITFQAGDKIVLSPGFGVQAGGVFKARISANKAQFVRQSVPARLTPGETVQASVTMRNIGKTAWTTASGIKLGSQATEGNTLWTGGNRVSLSISPVAEGQDHVFVFNITAPLSIGSYPFQWMMVQEGVEWFGEPSALFTVRVEHYGIGDEDDGLPGAYTRDSTGGGVPDSVKIALGLDVNTPEASVPGAAQGYQYDELQRLTDGPGRTYLQDPEGNILSP